MNNIEQKIISKEARYYQKNKQKILAKAKVYYENNKERICENSKENKKQHYQNNKEIYKLKAENWVAENKEQSTENKKNWVIKNKQKINKYFREWKALNKCKVYAWTAKRRGALLNATPSWLSKEELNKISEFYICAEMFAMYTGEKYHVDHIIPLRGKTVNGLHVPWNLQVIPAKENLVKSNKLYMSNIWE
jgi:hypothetical protein